MYNNAALVYKDILFWKILCGWEMPSLFRSSGFTSGLNFDMQRRASKNVAENQNIAFGNHFTQFQW